MKNLGPDFLKLTWGVQEIEAAGAIHERMVSWFISFSGPQGAKRKDPFPLFLILLISYTNPTLFQAFRVTVGYRKRNLQSVALVSKRTTRVSKWSITKPDVVSFWKMYGSRVIDIEAARFIHTKTYKLAQLTQLTHGDVCVENSANSQSHQLGVIPMWRQLYSY